MKEFYRKFYHRIGFARNSNNSGLLNSSKAGLALAYEGKTCKITKITKLGGVSTISPKRHAQKFVF